MKKDRLSEAQNLHQAEFFRNNKRRNSAVTILVGTGRL